MASKKLPARNVFLGVCLDRLSLTQLMKLRQAADTEACEREMHMLGTLLETEGANARWCAKRLMDAAYDVFVKKTLSVSETPKLDTACVRLMPFVRSAWTSRGRKFVEFINGTVVHWSQGTWNVVNTANSVRQ